MDYEVKGMDAIQRTQSNKAYRFISILTQEGETIDKVKVWEDFDDGRTAFAFINIGDRLMGQLKSDPKWGYSLSASKPKGTLNPQYAKKGTQIAQAQERKEQSIYQSQERKSEDIRISSTARDATLILTALMAHGGYDETKWKTQWVKIRAWLYKNWDNKDGYPDDLPEGDNPF